eukprot:149914-Amphidinium_carterae.1
MEVHFLCLVVASFIDQSIFFADPADDSIICGGIALEATDCYHLCVMFGTVLMLIGSLSHSASHPYPIWQRSGTSAQPIDSLYGIPRGVTIGIRIGNIYHHGFLWKGSLRRIDV